MRRTDPEGIIVRALQLRVTHRRVYNVKQPLSLWHMDGNHKLIRKVIFCFFEGGRVNNRGGRGQEEGSRWEIELHITL